MISNTVYEETCVPILNDTDLDEEERTQKLEASLLKELGISGKLLEDAVLDVLWRHRANKNPQKSNAPVRHDLGRPSSPSPWLQNNRPSSPSVLGSPSFGRASPAPRSSFGGSPAPAFIRSKSFGASSPFSSPRPSPRLAFAAPVVPHSPTLSNYEFSESHSGNTEYGDIASDSVDWILNDGLSSRPSSSGAVSVTETGLNAAAASWVQPQTSQMSSYDILRSVLGDGKTDEEIGSALEANSYDLSSAIATLMDGAPEQAEQNLYAGQQGSALIGKSMEMDQGLRLDLEGSSKSAILCKYWLASGTCLRADCRYSHDPSSHICKYWLAGNCMLGDSCMFSHDPALLMNRITMGNDSSSTSTGQLGPPFEVQDESSFPTLQSKAVMSAGQRNISYSINSLTGTPRQPREHTSMSGSPFGASGPRPVSRHHSGQYVQQKSAPLPDDSDAFPILGAPGMKPSKKHHGKRGAHNHGHAHKENTPSLISDVVRMSPGPSVGSLRKVNTKSNPRANNSTAASSIPAPQHIPWLETGAKVNHEYLRARQEAFKHGALRNKFLQSAAQAWNRNDARAAKALSLRGQSENDRMRKAHREASQVLYDSRNKDTGASSSELYVDLHGLHPEEAISFLEEKLVEQQKSGRFVYAITGTGHHSRNGKDKVGKAVRAFLTEWKYAFREFSAAGAEGMGGILGIDPGSFDKRVVAGEAAEGQDSHGDEMPTSWSAGGGTSTKVRIAKAVDKGEDEV